MTLIPQIGSTNITSRKEEIELSKVYEAYCGGFGYNRESLKTFICSRKISDLKSDLITFESLLEQKKWPVSKILQREVSKTRVDEIAKKYIAGNQEVKYFPPIIVALLPREGENLADTYVEKCNEDYSKAGLSLVFERSNFDKGIAAEKTAFIETTKSLTRAEGLFVNELYGGINFNLLAWDKNKFFAIIIDGQHRFESLKKASEDASSDINNYKQDVIFIDASEKFFESDRTISPPRIFRQIFIDINKNPVQVSKARQIIMNDSDPASLFVQSLIDDDQIDTTKYIAPELIDWHTNASKHELPYLSSVLNLHSLLQEKLMYNKELATISDLTETRKVTDWIKRLNDYLLVDKTIDKDNLNIEKLTDSFKRYENIRVNDEFELFTYDIRVLKIAQQNFTTLFRSSFLKFFKELKPYSDLIAHLETNNVFERGSSLNLALLRTPKNRSGHENTLFASLKVSTTQTLADKYFLFYTVVGQKALFERYYQFLIENRNSEIEEQKHIQLTALFVDKFNNVIQGLNSTGYYIFGPNRQNDSKLKEFLEENLNHKKLTKSYKGISVAFWDDLLYYDNNIKYNSIGVRAIRTVLQYLLDCYELTNEDLDKYPPFENGEFQSRISYKLQYDYEINDEDKRNKISAEFVKLKSDFLKYIIKLARL